MLADHKRTLQNSEVPKGPNLEKIQDGLREGLCPGQAVLSGPLLHA